MKLLNQIITTLGEPISNHMKNFLYALLASGIFYSCKSNTNQTAKDTSSARDSKQTQALIRQFKPIIQGVWIEKNYIEKVIKTRSPLAAADEIKGNTILYINTDHLKGDSLIIPAGDNHEGTQFTVKFHPGKSSGSIKISEGGELGYSIKKGDTILLLSFFDDQQKKMITTKFIKALNKQPDDDLGYGMNYMINKGLIAGNYTLTDSIGNISRVRFNNDGTVSGFLNFIKYNINIDLNEEPMDNLDEIYFSDLKNDRNGALNDDYSFKFSADTLNLYSTKPNSDSTKSVLDKLKYKLIKQK